MEVLLCIVLSLVALQIVKSFFAAMANYPELFLVLAIVVIAFLLLGGGGR